MYFRYLYCEELIWDVQGNDYINARLGDFGQKAVLFLTVCIWNRIHMSMQKTVQFILDIILVKKLYMYSEDVLQGYQ